MFHRFFLFGHLRANNVPPYIRSDRLRRYGIGISYEHLRPRRDNPFGCPKATNNPYGVGAPVRLRVPNRSKR